jgi:hypothetical protein
MHRWITALALVGAAYTAPLEAQVFTFTGCDGQRSCHRIEMTRDFWSFGRYPDGTWPQAGGRTFDHVFRVHALTYWHVEGAFADCGMGCAWNVANFPRPYIYRPPEQDDFYHASSRCYSYGGSFGPVYYPCTGLDAWGGQEIYTWEEWRPEGITVRLTYSETPGEVTTLLLTPVPEPTTALLIGMGAVGLGLVTRRRRLS